MKAKQVKTLCGNCDHYFEGIPEIDLKDDCYKFGKEAGKIHKDRPGCIAWVRKRPLKRL